MSALTLNSWDERERLFIHSVDRSGGLTGPRTAQGSVNEVRFLTG